MKDETQINRANRTPAIGEQLPIIYAVQMLWTFEEDESQLMSYGGYSRREDALAAFQKVKEQLYTNPDTWEYAALQEPEGYHIEDGKDYFSIYPDGEYKTQHTDLFITEIRLVH